MRGEEASTSLQETVTFIVHAIKQVSWGFERLNSIADSYEDGSAAKAFYLSAIYNYIAAFYLLDAKKGSMGGTFHEALKRHNLSHLLDPIVRLLREPMGRTTFGEVVRVVRNKAVVHTTYRDRDLDRLYSKVDMQKVANQARFQELLVEMDQQNRELALRLLETTGLPPNEFGMTRKHEEAG